MAALTDTKTAAPQPAVFTQDEARAVSGSIRVWTPGIEWRDGERFIVLPVVVERASEEEGGYVGYCPCLPGCAVQGEDTDEVLMALQETAEDLAQVAAEAGGTLPLRMYPVEDSPDIVRLGEIRLSGNG